MAFDESAFQRVSCTADTPVIRMSQLQDKIVTLSIRDDNGDAVDLDQFASTAGVLLSSSSSSGGKLTVRMATSQWSNSNNNVFEISGTIVNATTGLVSFHITPTETNLPGVFVASVGVFWNGVLKFQTMYYIELMPNNFALTARGPLTVPIVRLELMDTCPDANYLLDELEFTDAEIVHAMRKTVDVFNDANPPVGGYSYDSFPYFSGWIKGTVAFLLKMVSHKYRRNALQYSAGGITIADQERYRAYEQMAAKEEQEYRDWVTQKKVSINIGLGYGSLGPSPYGRWSN